MLRALQQTTTWSLATTTVPLTLFKFLPFSESSVVPHTAYLDVRMFFEKMTFIRGAVSFFIANVASKTKLYKVCTEKQLMEKP